MADIFLSHAVADQKLAEMIVDFLVDAIGVSEKSVFCSSLTGHGNPLAHDFNKNMREQIQDPKLVILLMTPAYMDSRFCLMELGATWALGLKPLPIVVPPVTFDDVKNSIGQIQSWRITNSDELESIRETVLDTLQVEGRSNHAFARKKKRWEEDLAIALDQLAPSPKVSRSEYDDLQAAMFAQSSRADLCEKDQETLKEELAKFHRLRPVAIILEPEKLVALDIQQQINNAGFVCAGVARTKEEAVLLARAVQPDVLVAETRLEYSSGIDAVVAIKEELDAYPLFVTAFPEDLLSPKRPDPSRLITKPFAPSKLISELRKAYADVVETRAHLHRMAQP
ncbi:TIR domain-containing protein [Rhizobium sp. 2MFCol3.1]|jgi:CheY-like chemotaxis protein|uniref:TIR domain-containing protein n=1 Tax=Rhizobium sp. 2MFCol3.1 TaxID=1246459 RepID=UPI0003A0E1CB|nr:TIR domain-containing protein [Rhizobium sp. 2MFCol3.1]